MAHLSMGPRVRLPLYAITGRADATIPTGESVAATYANLAAFESAVTAVAGGEACQLAGWPTAGALTRLVAE